MKKILYLILLLCYTAVLTAAGETTTKTAINPANAIFADIAVDGQAAAMGDLKAWSNPAEYALSDSFEIKYSMKNQLGIIPYTEVSAVKGFGSLAGIGFKMITSEDNLKTSKFSGGIGLSLGFLTVGGNINVYQGETTKKSNMPENFAAKLVEKGITDEVISAKVEGMGYDAGVVLDLGNIYFGYVAKNISSKLKWTVNNKVIEDESYSGNLTLYLEQIYSVGYKDGRMLIKGEVENLERINLGFERKYYDVLSIRLGVSRNLKSIENIKGQKIYSIGFGLTPDIMGLKAGVNLGYQMKYFGRDDLGSGTPQDDIAVTAELKF